MTPPDLAIQDGRLMYTAHGECLGANALSYRDNLLYFSKVVQLYKDRENKTFLREGLNVNVIVTK